MTIMKILNLGYDNPLSLSMGHPVKDRVKRLHHSKARRGGTIVISLLISTGLALTSLAKENFLSFNEHAPLFTSDKGVTIQGVPFAISYMAAEDLQPTLEYKIQGKYLMPTFQPIGENLLYNAREDGFPPMPFIDACIEHVFNEKQTPLWYARTGKILKTDAEGKAYIVACIPGTSQERKSFTAEDFTKSVETSSSLNATEKQALIADIRTRDGFHSFGGRPQFVDDGAMISRIRAIKNMSEQQKLALIKSIQSGTADITVRSKSDTTRSMYKMNPNLSEAQRKALMKRISSGVTVETLTLSSDMSAEEQRKKKQEWFAEQDARMAQKGMIKVDPEEAAEFLDVFEE